jgi:hypothetical protein
MFDERRHNAVAEATTDTIVSEMLTNARLSTDNPVSMKIQRVAAFVTLVGFLLAPMLPPAHVHRGASGSHASFVHRHFAPHTTASGTHVGHPGVADGAPQWLDDPVGSTPDSPVVRAEPTALGFHVLRPPLARGEYVASPPEPSVHAPPGRPTGLRAPPSIG